MGVVAHTVVFVRVASGLRGVLSPTRMKTLDFDADAEKSFVEDADWKRLAASLRPASKSVRVVGDASATFADASATFADAMLTYAVSFENGSDAPETLYVSRSAAYPAGGFLHLDLEGEGVVMRRGLRGPEVYSAIGKTVALRFVLPANTAIRLTGVIPLSFVEYSGSPVAQLKWLIYVNSHPTTGAIATSLPSRP
jgi:hypothetical protein